ncbi:unnamed protein product [Linum trigynum]|uniref:Uncharacterized protein n=1 Tax=Linum trigynum TaxID=586398 RepID=A0AAV2FQS8_9ROSI
MRPCKQPLEESGREKALSFVAQREGWRKGRVKTERLETAEGRTRANPTCELPPGTQNDFLSYSIGTSERTRHGKGRMTKDITQDSQATEHSALRPPISYTSSPQSSNCSAPATASCNSTDLNLDLPAEDFVYVFIDDQITYQIYVYI